MTSGHDMKEATATYTGFTKAITVSVVAIAILVAIVVGLIAR